MFAYVIRRFPVYFHDKVEMFEAGRTIPIASLDEFQLAESVARYNGGEIRLFSL